MRTRMMAFSATALTAAGLIGWGAGQLATEGVASPAQLSRSVSRSQVSTVQASSSRPSPATPCSAHSAIASS